MIKFVQITPFRSEYETSTIAGCLDSIPTNETTAGYLQFNNITVDVTVTKQGQLIFASLDSVISFLGEYESFMNSLQER